MKLTGQQIQRIHNAILAGYSPDSLRMMVRVQMNENLHNIAGGATFSDQVFTLIEWAERQGRTLELVQAAQQANPSNDALHALLKDAQTWRVSLSGTENISSLSAVQSSTTTEQKIQTVRLDHSDMDDNLEKAICLKSEAEFALLLRKWDESPISREQIAKLEENIKSQYGRQTVLSNSIDIRVESHLIPLVNDLIKIESELRAKYRVPFRQERMEYMRDKLRNLVTKNWSYIVKEAYEDAIQSVVLRQAGTLHEYQESELRQSRNKLLSRNPEGLFVVIDELLQKALADSILLAR